MFCTRCGAQAARADAFCGRCGQSLAPDADPSDTTAPTEGPAVEPPGGPLAPPAAADPPPSNAWARVAQSAASVGGEPRQRFDREPYAAVIGPRNTEYYLERFHALQQGGSPVGWHWPAFFATGFWLLHRRMWGLALAYWLVLPYAVGVPLMLLLRWLGVGDGLAFLVVVVLVYVAPAMFATAIYHWWCRRRIERARARGKSGEALLATVEVQGGTGGAAVLAAVLIVGMMFIGVLAAVALPAYQDYTARARVAEAMSLLDEARADVVSHFARTRELPSELPILQYRDAVPRFVTKLFVHPGTGAVVAEVHAGDAVKGFIALRPTLAQLEARDRSAWACVSDLPVRMLPRPCQTR
jgi:hypothetical protein